MTEITDNSQAVLDLTNFLTAINTEIPTTVTKKDYEARIKTLSTSILNPKNPLNLPILFASLTNAILSASIINKDIVSTLLYFNPFKFPMIDHEAYFSLLKHIASKFQFEIQILNHLFSLILINSYTHSTETIFRRIILTLSSLNRIKGFKAKINIKIKTLVNQAFKVLEEKGDYKMLVLSFVLSFRTRVYPDCFVKELLEQTIATFNKEETNNRTNLMCFYKELFNILNLNVIKQYKDNKVEEDNNTKRYYELIEPVKYDKNIIQNIKNKKEKFIYSFIKIINRDILIFDNNILNQVMLCLFNITNNTNNNDINNNNSCENALLNTKESNNINKDNSNITNGLLNIKDNSNNINNKEIKYNNNNNGLYNIKDNKDNKSNNSNEENDYIKIENKNNSSSNNNNINNENKEIKEENDNIEHIYKSEILNRLYNNVFNSHQCKEINNIKKGKKCIKSFVNSNKISTNTTELKKWFKSFAILSQLLNHTLVKPNTYFELINTMQNKVLNSSLYFVEYLCGRINKLNHKQIEVEIIKLKGCLYFLLNTLCGKENKWTEYKSRLIKLLNEEKIERNCVNEILYKMIEEFNNKENSGNDHKEDNSINNKKERIFINKKNKKLENELFEIMRKKYI